MTAHHARAFIPSQLAAVYAGVRRLGEAWRRRLAGARARLVTVRSDKVAAVPTEGGTLVITSYDSARGFDLVAFSGGKALRA